jgi:hypothetical protein
MSITAIDVLAVGSLGFAIGAAAAVEQAFLPTPKDCVRRVADFGPPEGCGAPEQPHRGVALTGLSGTIGSSVSTVHMTVISSSYTVDFENYQPDAPWPPRPTNQMPPTQREHARSAQPQPLNWYTLNYVRPPDTLILPPNVIWKST